MILNDGTSFDIKRNSRAFEKFLRTNPALLADLQKRGERVAKTASSSGAGYQFKVGMFVGRDRAMAQVEPTGKTRFRKNWPAVLLGSLDAGK
jgi:hypothetical protein